MAAHQKKAARRKAHLVFIDESGFSLNPCVKRTWGLRGQTPVLRHRVRHWRKLSVIAALTLSPKRRRVGLYLQVHAEGAIRQDQVIEFLGDLLRHLRGSVVVVWDNLNAHRSRRLRQWAARRSRLRLEYLPPYAPELNPVEGLWCTAKHHRLANHGLADLPSLAEAVERTIGQIAEDPPLLRGLFRATPLSWRKRR